MIFVFCLLLLVAIYFLVKTFSNKRVEGKEVIQIPESWHSILEKHVHFYQRLDEGDKVRFQHKVYEFLQEVKIIGVKTEVEEIDRLFVASSAVIPIFNFPDWHYQNLDEVLIYPDRFNKDFELVGNDRTILGMVGTGILDDKMILAKTALRHGFSNKTDKFNVGVHEFVHLIDDSDDVIDGIPFVLLDNPASILWMKVMKDKIHEIENNQSDINPYGATNYAEFFSVTSEYFFERPFLLKRKHPKLYEILNEIYT